MNSYYTGDSIDIEATLSLNGIADPDIATTTIQGAIVALDKKTIIVGPITATIVDVVTSRVKLSFTSEQTTGLKAGKYFIEIQGTRTGGKVITWGQQSISLLTNAIPPL